MTIELTEQQQKTLDAPDGSLPRIVDPRTSATYVLIPASDYETVREVLEDEQCQQAIRATALRNAAGRMEDVP